MQFRVPQFIDIEDKILGPLSWRQFAYVLGAAAVAYISLRLLPSKVKAPVSAAENLKPLADPSTPKRGSFYEKKNLQDLAVGLDIKIDKEESDVL